MHENRIAVGASTSCLLKTFRRGYVRRMAATRQGDHNQCPWDVLDPRDLKFYANQPGYYWESEDDPFTGRENFGFARAGLAEMIIFSSVLIPMLALFIYLSQVHSPWWWIAAIVPFLLETEVVWFFGILDESFQPNLVRWCPRPTVRLI